MERSVVDLTNEDVADILAVLDSLPYDELDLQTPRFRLTLRRTAGGGWSEESQVLADPVPVMPVPDGPARRSQEGAGTGPRADAAEPDAAGAGAARADDAAGAGAAGADDGADADAAGADDGAGLVA